MANTELDRIRREFFTNVWDHAQDPFQAQFDERRPLSKEERAFIEQAAKLVNSTPDKEFGYKLFELIGGSSEKLSLLLQICGLTRNKIITDLKAASFSMKSTFSFPSSYFSLAKSKKAWTLAGPYMAIKLRRILGQLPPDLIQTAAESLNQATWPGFIRQERAKRSGHEGEYRLATLMASCDIPFEPMEKAENPICPDVQINGISFDLVVPNVDDPKVCFKATVHTANIGQYGESKDYLEIVEATQMLNENYSEFNKPILMALIDGIGFSSNRAGLDGVLTMSNEFCQYKTLWKSIVVCSSKIGIPLLLKLPTDTIGQHQDFLDRYDYMKYIVTEEKTLVDKLVIPAGEGNILLEKTSS